MRFCTLLMPISSMDVGCGWTIVFTAIFNNISVISWWSVLLVQESRVPEKTDLPQVTDKLLSHNVVSSTPCHERD